MSGRTGIGVTDLRSIQCFERISDLFQITNAELVAILKAIIAVEKICIDKLVIFTDSMNGCKWMRQGPHDNYLVHFIRERISQLHDKTINIQWIPSHVGIKGNEEADQFANRGCQLNSKSELKITFSDAFSALKSGMLSAWQAEYLHVSLTKGRRHFEVLNNISRRPWFHNHNIFGSAIKLLTRLRTQHGLCGAVKFLFKLQDTPVCDVCRVYEDLEHIILRCKKFRTQRSTFLHNVQVNSLAELLCIHLSYNFVMLLIWKFNS